MAYRTMTLGSDWLVAVRVALVAGVCLTPLLAAFASDTAEESEDAKTGETQAVTIDERRFVLEIAADADSRRQGLSDRESIAGDGGMLFVFPDAEERTFWMYHCLVPIDILYLSPEGEVVKMYQMEVEPYGTPTARLKRYPSGKPAQFAIELKGGTLDDLEIEVGDRIDLPLEDLKRLAE